jgi:hypothetical protein
VSAAGPTAQSEYPAARKAAWAAKATPSWAPRKAGRAALTTAIAAASVTIALRCGGPERRGSWARGDGGVWRGGEWVVSGVWGVLEESSGRSYYLKEGKKQGGPILYRPKFVVSV